MLDKVGELVTESEGQQGAGKDYESAFPSQFPDQQGDDSCVHWCPDELVREECPDGVSYK